MFGIWGHEKAAEITYYGLHALQHRGQDGTGLTVSDGKRLKLHRGVGLVNDVFKNANFSSLTGHAAIGHVRNATQDDEDVDHVQPLMFPSQTESMAIAHNGNIMNAHTLRGHLEDEGSILQTRSDTEVLAHLMKRSGNKLTEEKIGEALRKLVGAYTFLMLTEQALYIATDPHGIRPLSIGRLGDAYVVASETSAFNIVGATYERDVLPGELIKITEEGIHVTNFSQRKTKKMCAMEYVYFSRPDSDLNGINVHTARKKTGIELAKEAPAEADVVTGVPDSSISAAIGYAEQIGLPYEMGIIKNRYIGRTFIKPSPELREQGVKIKLSPVKGIVDGKRVIMIDDSIVRGTTCKHIVQLLKEAGAKEVHVRISSPMITDPCYYGIDMSTKEELIAANYSLDEISDLIGADSIAFLSHEGMERGIIDESTYERSLCQSCFTGNYPMQPRSQDDMHTNE